MHIQMDSLKIKIQDNKTRLNRMVLFLGMGLLLSHCHISQSSEESPLTVSSKLVRSFVTDDTTLFYSAVEMDSVVKHFNKKPGAENYNSHAVTSVFFFRYAPWKISQKGLQERKDHPFPFSHFELDNINRDEGAIRATLRWQEIHSDSLKSLILNLYEKEPRVWKIKAIDFPTD
jgi:hypothetical protein